MNMNGEISIRPRLKLARNLFIILAWSFLGFITVQVFLAGIGLFVDADQWELHRILARFFALVPLVMLTLAFLGNLPVRLRWICLGLFLMVVSQFITVIISSQIGFLSALHPVIALLLFWGAITLVIQGHKSRNSI